jgi:hypothetical protein
MAAYVCLFIYSISRNKFKREGVRAATYSISRGGSMNPKEREQIIRLLEGVAALITVLVGILTAAHLLGWL